MGEQLRNLIRTDLEEGWVLCEDVHLPSGVCCTVYISPNGVYVLSADAQAPQSLYQEIRGLMGALRVRLYLFDAGDGTAGVYDDLCDTLGGELSEAALEEDIETWLTSGRVIYSQTGIEQMVSRLKSADMQARGYIVQDDGQIYLLRHGTLKKASSLSSDILYYLTLFGGPLGIHRFALGKFMSGLCYLCTGGLFLLGWLLDILLLFLGAQKDKQKGYLLPLANRRFKLILLPLGLAAGLALFLGYLRVSDQIGIGFNGLLSNQIRTTDPEFFMRLIETLKEFTGE